MQKRALRTALTVGIATGVVGAVAGLFVASVRPAGAFPGFTKKEEKPCGYCHVNPQGGGKRNYRGRYYKGHGLSFAEFDDEAEAKAAGEPVGPEPEPKPKSWTAPKTAAPATTPPADAGTPATPPTTPAETPKQPTVAELTAKSKVAEAAYKKAPKDPAAKKAYAASLADLAHGTMLDQSIPPKKRYPDALSLCRKALALDPTNQSAATDKKLIEDAYKSMGKPIPK